MIANKLDIISLTNSFVDLRPLRKTDYESLYQVAADPLIWQQHQIKDRWKKDKFDLYFDECLVSEKALVILKKADMTVIGCSRYANVTAHPNELEIGWTFLAREFWGGQFNQSVKHLMINHAFKYADAIVFFIDRNNVRSQRAVKKIGASQVTNSALIKSYNRPESDLVFRITKTQWVDV